MFTEVTACSQRDKVNEMVDEVVRSLRRLQKVIDGNIEGAVSNVELNIEMASAGLMVAYLAQAQERYEAMVDRGEHLEQ